MHHQMSYVIIIMCYIFDQLLTFCTQYVMVTCITHGDGIVGRGGLGS